MLLEGQKVSLGVHPDAVITEDYSLPDGTSVHVIVGEEEQDKLFALQGILDDEGWFLCLRTYQIQKISVSITLSVSSPFAALWFVQV